MNTKDVPFTESVKARVAVPREKGTKGIQCFFFFFLLHRKGRVFPAAKWPHHGNKVYNART